MILRWLGNSEKLRIDRFRRNVKGSGFGEVPIRPLDALNSSFLVHIVTWNIPYCNY
jgi:hypothetical protein